MVVLIMLTSRCCAGALSGAFVCAADAPEVWSIHREAPEFTEQSTEQEILATGIKVSFISLIAAIVVLLLCTHRLWILLATSCSCL